MKRILGVVGAGLCMAVLVSVAPVQADDARITAVLNGPAERPGPGDPDAWGRAVITIDDATNRICLTLQYTRVDGTLSGLHIHLAPPTAAGPVVVPFSVPTRQDSGVHVECKFVENEEVLDGIAANPGEYYLNLHSAPSFGPGAIRGQLQAY